MTAIERIQRNSDLRAIALLIVLWLLFFWRLFTPIASDQASLTQGDFSGQFVAFGAYQYERLSRGEIPLWNPYNNGGFPFIADTQAAAFYPPRWLAIGVSSLADGWSYNALQLEMTFHVLLFTILMYAFVRRLTLGAAQSRLAALISAIIIGYGGYTTGYPPLQLAVLEAACWFPLVALGILEATRARKTGWRFIALAAFALGLSWLAGHPQTSWFITYVAVAYLAFRCYDMRLGWRIVIGALVLLSVITIGVTAVTLFPGIEYLLHTSREELGFAAKGNGFPFRDIAQFVFPGSVSQWSPLYAGLPALFFVFIAIWRRAGESRFWLVVLAVSLLHSVGENSAFYHLSYNFVPGLRFFRGQERAAVVVANSLAILAGLGVVAAASWRNQVYQRRALRFWGWFTLALVAIAAIMLFAWVFDAATWADIFSIATRSAIVAAVAYPVLTRFLRDPGRISIQVFLVALIAFELFSVNIDQPANYDPVPANEQLSMTPPPLVEQILEDDNGGQPFRVDGFRGLQGNFGSIYAVMDIRGISPLWLKGPELIVYADYANNPLAWELFAVKYVFSGSQSLSVPSSVIGRGNDHFGTVFLHRLENPRPFAILYYDADVVDTDEWALELMGDIRYDERDNIVVHQPLTLELPGQVGVDTVDVESFAPEEIILNMSVEYNAILSLSLPHYPGWEAQLDGNRVDIMRAYAGLSAVEIPAGQHKLTLRFAPLSYTVGSLFSLLTWLALGLLTIYVLWRK